MIATLRRLVSAPSEEMLSDTAIKEIRFGRLADEEHIYSPGQRVMLVRSNDSLKALYHLYPGAKGTVLAIQIEKPSKKGDAPQSGLRVQFDHYKHPLHLRSHNVIAEPED